VATEEVSTPRPTADRRHRAAKWAIAALAVAYLAMAQGAGGTPPSNNTGAHYALIRALADGTPTIDKTIGEVGSGGTSDYSKVNGHYYATKAPGLAFETLPAYLILKAAGGAKPVSNDIKQIWYLTIFGAVIPAVILLLLVYRIADRLAPGYGLLATVILGVGTMVLPFATLFFSHSLSTMLLFAAFAVLWRERAGPPRLELVLAAGVLAGLAATTDFVVAVPGAVIGGYALARAGRAARAGAYAGGALLGGLPALLFNQWAFGSPLKFSYANAVLPGVAHPNKVGLFGITAPNFHDAAELLFAPVGLLTLMPVLAIGAVGAVFLYRAGWKAEAVLIGGIALANYLVIAGYTGGDTATNGPIGGGTPGPRFLMPMLPFLTLGVAAALRRIPITTLALAVCSLVQMVVITMTLPLNAPWTSWFHSLARGTLSTTVLSFVGQNRVGIAVFLIALAAAIGIAVASTPLPRIDARDVTTAALAVAGWLLFVFRGPPLLSGNTFGSGAAAVFVFAAGIALFAAAVPRLVLGKAAVAQPR
jgi:hypothetical protein